MSSSMWQSLIWFCVSVCACIWGSGCFFFLLSVTYYIPLFKFQIITLALKKKTSNKQIFTCRRISITFCLPELNIPGTAKAAEHAPSGVPLAPALHLCHGLPMLSLLQIPSRKQTNASPLTYKFIRMNISACLQKELLRMLKFLT